MTKQLTAAQSSFRTAMANLSAAVSVVTSNGPSGRAGITVSAICSVTDSPPTMIVCVNQSSYVHTIFRSNRRLCVNILSAQDKELASHFAGTTGVPMAERFTWPVWDHASQNIPMLHSAAARVVGRILSDYTQGSHSIFLVDVEQVYVREDADALVYFQRQFHGVGATDRSHGNQEGMGWPIRTTA